MLAQDAQTKPDFIAKLSVSRKESREVRYWLRLALETAVVTAGEIEWELNEASRLRSVGNSRSYGEARRSAGGAKAAALSPIPLAVQWRLETPH